MCCCWCDILFVGISALFANIFVRVSAFVADNPATPAVVSANADHCRYALAWSALYIAAPAIAEASLAIWFLRAPLNGHALAG